MAPRVEVAQEPDRMWKFPKEAQGVQALRSGKVPKEAQGAQKLGLTGNSNLCMGFNGCC